MVSLISISNKAILLLSKIRPRWLRKGLFSFLKKFGFLLLRLKSILFEIRLPIYKIRGTLKDSDELVSLLFVGINGFPIFLEDILFEGSPCVERFGSVFVWRLDTLNRFSFDFDSVFVSCDRFFQRWLHKYKFVIFPHMIDMVLDVPSSMDNFYRQLNNSAKSDVRKVKKYSYNFEISSDENQLKMFYDEMYVPLISKRVRKGLITIPPYSYYKVLYEIGYRLLIVKDSSGSNISGCFFYIHDDILFTRDFGVVNGNNTLIRKGAENAIFYFSIIYAKRLGLNRVDFGYCRPISSDGIYQYKKKWGMTVRKPQKSFFPGIFGLKIFNPSSNLTVFFKENTFFTFDKAGNLIKYNF